MLVETWSCGNSSSALKPPPASRRVLWVLGCVRVPSCVVTVCRCVYSWWPVPGHEETAPDPTAPGIRCAEAGPGGCPSRWEHLSALAASCLPSSLSPCRPPLLHGGSVHSSPPFSSPSHPTPCSAASTPPRQLSPPRGHFIPKPGLHAPPPPPLCPALYIWELQLGLTPLPSGPGRAECSIPVPRFPVLCRRTPPLCARRRAGRCPCWVTARSHQADCQSCVPPSNRWPGTAFPRLPPHIHASLPTSTPPSTALCPHLSLCPLPRSHCLSLATRAPSVQPEPGAQPGLVSSTEGEASAPSS